MSGGVPLSSVVRSVAAGGGSSSNRSDFVGLHRGGGYASDMSGTAARGGSSSSSMVHAHPSRAALLDAADRGARAGSASVWHGLDAYSRHKRLMMVYRNSDEARAPIRVKTDADVLRENHRFIRSDAELEAGTWEEQLAIKYYAALFQEYCLADMTRYKEGAVGLRWRTQKEVVSGKGQFVCGNVKCASSSDLESFEVNFSYVEAGVKKRALVKLRVCPDCALKLHYKKMKAMRKEARRKRKYSDASVDSEVAQEQSEKKPIIASKRNKSGSLDDVREDAEEVADPSYTTTATPKQSTADAVAKRGTDMDEFLSDLLL